MKHKNNPPSLHESINLTASAVVICSITTFSCGSFCTKGPRTVSINTFSRSNMSTAGSVTSPWTCYHTQIISIKEIWSSHFPVTQRGGQRETNSHALHSIKSIISHRYTISSRKFNTTKNKVSQIFFHFQSLTKHARKSTEERNSNFSCKK